MNIPMETKIVYLLPTDDQAPCIFRKGATYIIPEYQRDYSWGEKQIEDFMSSVRRTLEGEAVFMGTVQFARDSERSNEFHVIDGQQRLTSFLLLLRIIDQLLDSNIIARNGVALQVKNSNFGGVELSRVLSLPYQEISAVVNSKKARAEFEKSKGTYEKNLCYIKAAVEEILSDCADRTAAVQHLLDSVINRIYFVELATTGMPLPQVVGIFNTINTTGLDLNCADLFKLQYYEFLKYYYPEGGNWMTEISSCYETAKESGIKMSHVLDVYKHCIVAKFNLKYEMLSKTNESFFDAILSVSKPNAKIDPSDKIFRFDGFKRLLSLYTELEQERRKEGSRLVQIAKYDELLAVEMISLTRYSRYWTLPYVDAFFRCSEKDTAEQRAHNLRHSLKNAVAAAKYFIVCSVNFDKVIKPVHTFICNHVLTMLPAGNNPLELIRSRISDAPYEDWTDKKKWNTRKFVERIQNDLCENGTRCFVVCTLSALLDEKDAGTDPSTVRNLLFNWDAFKYDIEHIYARSRFQKKDKADASVYNSIGNLVALDRNINRGVKDNEVLYKVQFYANSKLAAAKAIGKKSIEEYNSNWDLAQIQIRAKEQTQRLCDYLGLE